MRSAESEVIPGLRRIFPTVFSDDRGEFVETWNADDYAFADAAGAPLDWAEDDLSVSHRHVLRGLHGDERTWKLVMCVSGALRLVVVDCRGDSAGYRRWEPFDLSDRERVQVLIPAGCATGLLALSEPTVFAYKQSQRYRGAAGQFTVRWDDPALGIDWPTTDVRISERDATAPFLAP